MKKTRTFSYIGWCYEIDGQVAELDVYNSEAIAKKFSDVFIKVEANPASNKPGVCVGVVPFPKK